MRGRDIRLEGETLSFPRKAPPQTSRFDISMPFRGSHKSSYNKSPMLCIRTLENLLDVQTTVCLNASTPKLCGWYRSVTGHERNRKSVPFIDQMTDVPSRSNYSPWT